MRLSDLRGTKVKTLDGEILGRVHEVQCKRGEVTALVVGTGGLVEMLTAKKKGRRVPWECVRKIDRKEILVTPDPPQRQSRKAPATRSRKGTRRASAQRSRR